LRNIHNVSFFYLIWNAGCSSLWQEEQHNKIPYSLSCHWFFLGKYLVLLVHDNSYLRQCHNGALIYVHVLFADREWWRCSLGTWCQRRKWVCCC
jgi:hypothetical protein